MPSLEHLSNPEYLHVLLNPLPVYGLAMGGLGLLFGLVANTRGARIATLLLVFIGAISAWPVYHYGQAGYDRVLAMADSEGAKWLDEHMRRGEQLIYVFYLVGALAVVAIVAEFKFLRAARPLAIATLILAGANLALGGYISYAGGHVRHREFRFEPAPEKPKEEEHHHHGEGGEDHHDASPSPAESAAPMDHGAMPGMQSPAGQQSPMPMESPPEQTAEQIEASRLQLEASRLQLEASRKQLEAAERAKQQAGSPSPSRSPTPPQHEHGDHPH